MCRGALDGDRGITVLSWTVSGKYVGSKKRDSEAGKRAQGCEGV